MGLFDKLLSSKPEPLTSQSALLLACITMIASDGSIDDDELAIVRRLDTSESTSDWNLAVKTWKANSPESCVQLVTPALNSDQRLGVLANLVDIAMADGSLHGNEKKLLEAYVAAFQVDSSAIEKIVEVISIKNNKALYKK